MTDAVDDHSTKERLALREIATGCLCQKARNASRVLTRFYDAHFAGSGIEPTQFNLLVAIRLAEPVPVVRLADYLGLERTTLTRNVKVLERDGLVSVGGAADARRRELSLTAKGLSALRRNLPRWQAAQRAAAAALGEAAFSRLSDALLLANKLQRQEGDSNERS